MESLSSINLSLLHDYHKLLNSYIVDFEYIQPVLTALAIIFSIVFIRSSIINFFYLLFFICYVTPCYYLGVIVNIFSFDNFLSFYVEKKSKDSSVSEVTFENTNNPEKPPTGQVSKTSTLPEENTHLRDHFSIYDHETVVFICQVVPILSIVKWILDIYYYGFFTHLILICLLSYCLLRGSLAITKSNNIKEAITSSIIVEVIPIHILVLLIYFLYKKMLWINGNKDIISFVV